jgi:hypothetical protein
MVMLPSLQLPNSKNTDTVAMQRASYARIDSASHLLPESSLKSLIR